MPRRLPSLDDYDLTGVRSDEAALWSDDIRYALEDRIDSPTPDGFLVETL